MRGHVALCLLAATSAAVIAKDLVAAKVMDPNLPFQHITPKQALAKLTEVRLKLVGAGERTVEPVSPPTGVWRDFPCRDAARARDLGELWIKS